MARYLGLSVKHLHLGADGAGGRVEDGTVHGKLMRQPVAGHVAEHRKHHPVVRELKSKNLVRLIQ